MNKLPIFLDLDEVTCDFLGKLIFVYNSKYNTNIKLEDIKEWNLTNIIGKKGIDIFLEPGFFTDLKPIGNCVEIIKKLLNDKEEVFIITRPMNKFNMFEKYAWIEKFLPFFPTDNLITVGNKGGLLKYINKGILFDDCPEYLQKYKGITVCMDRPYNQGVKSDHRIFNNDWNEFYKIVRGIKMMRENSI